MKKIKAFFRGVKHLLVFMFFMDKDSRFILPLTLWLTLFGALWLVYWVYSWINGWMTCPGYLVSDALRLPVCIKTGVVIQ
jgi:cytochrome bd-type quinol oxidase subunit 1